MVLDYAYIVGTAELPVFTSVTRLLSGLKCEVMLHHEEASLQ